LLDASENSQPIPLWGPQPGPQTDAITAKWCPELFYGGAAGGGKSDFLLGDYLQDVPTYGKAWRGVLFRRTYPELEELISRSKEMYPQTGASWNDQKKQWTWPNGANLKMRYAERNDDALRYQGHQYTWVGFDELTQWATLYIYRYLRSRLRSAHNVPHKRMRSSANPGGPGHLEVKRYFVDPAPAGYEPIRDPETGIDRMFIPARLTDNLILSLNDPEYESRLRALGSSTLVKALLEGDWSVIEGAFFDCWDAARHILRPFTVPRDWKRFRSMDWGSARPFSVGWWALCPDTFTTDNMFGEPIEIPRGALVRYREWYGAKEPNVGLKMDAEQVGRNIKSKDLDDVINGGVLDPACFATHGGPSIAEMLAKGGAVFAPADNTRVPQRGAMAGWDQLRRRLLGNAEGHPMIFFFSTCADSIRTIPVLQHDKDRPEDIDTEAEDHAADEVRYACNSRPFIPEAKRPKPQNQVYMADAVTGVLKSNFTLNDAIKRLERNAKRR
jgi:hypothetical protein